MEPWNRVQEATHDRSQRQNHWRYSTLAPSLLPRSAEGTILTTRKWSKAVGAQSQCGLIRTFPHYFRKRMSQGFCTLQRDNLKIQGSKRWQDVDKMLTRHLWQQVKVVQRNPVSGPLGQLREAFRKMSSMNSAPGIGWQGGDPYSPGDLVQESPELVAGEGSKFILRVTIAQCTIQLSGANLHQSAISKYLELSWLQNTADLLLPWWRWMTLDDAGSGHAAMRPSGPRWWPASSRIPTHCWSGAAALSREGAPWGRGHAVWVRQKLGTHLILRNASKMQLNAKLDVC